MAFGPQPLVNIRRANIEELGVIHTIIRDATLNMDQKGIPQWDEIYPNKEILTNDIKRKEMHVIVQEGRVAGFVVINEEQPPEYAGIGWRHPGRALVVHRLTVDPIYQGRGLATCLMDFVEETAVIEGYNCIRLDAFTRNPVAFKLYEGRGYRNAGVVLFRKGEFYCYEKPMKTRS